MKIETGVKKEPVKTMIYGTEGIGKTTLASQFPNPLFIDLERGSNQINVARFSDPPSNWEELLKYIEYVRDNSDICKTLVIDTIDEADRLCANYVCKKFNKKGIENFGYGQGYTYVGEEFINFIKSINEVIDAGIHVVLLAHSKLQRVEQPEEVGSYDKYAPKLTRNVQALVKGWADLVLFLNYKTYVSLVQGSKDKYKASGRDRVIYTSYTPSWDAKNRFGLPDELPLEYNAIKRVIEPSDDDLTKTDMELDTKGDFSLLEDDPDFDLIVEEIPEKLKLLMDESKVSEEQVIKGVALAGKCKEVNPETGKPTKIADLDPDFVNKMLINKWNGFKENILEGRNII